MLRSARVCSACGVSCVAGTEVTTEAATITGCAGFSACKGGAAGGSDWAVILPCCAQSESIKLQASLVALFTVLVVLARAEHVPSTIGHLHLIVGTQ